MPLEEHLSDDFIASLLAKDAKASNSKHSTYGLQELLPKRPTYSAPKANTRFLKNIIRETDNHNAALRAKEITESRSRLRKLHEGSGTSSSGEGDYGRLSRGDDHRSKRRRVEREDETGPNRRRTYGKKTESKRNHDTHSRSHHSDRGHRDSRYDGDGDDDGESRRHDRHHRHRSRRQRSRNRSLDRYRGSRDCRRSSRLPPRSRSRSPRRERKHYRQRSHHRSDSKPLKASGEDEQRNFSTKSYGSHEDSKTVHRNLLTEAKPASSPASDSDPLEAIIGPTPPPPKPKVKARGRGTFASASAMDSHFSSSYDPAIDVQPDPDMDDDWDMALEALRDRQKWQRQGAERLKAAGFTEEEVQKWEKGGEKTEEDVKWRGRGEGREWDRGKVVGEDGIETKPEWGRLKGS